MTQMHDGADVASMETRLRELTEHTLEATRERTACERTIASSRAALEGAQRELPGAEREAKERRQSQNDAIRGRAELEHRLAELVEAEDLTRARRQQAEQRAQGFRAAAAFASTGRAEAESSSDQDRAERERMVEDRATREAAAAEARATEELAEETKVARHRAEIESHVEAERSLETEIANDRTTAEARVAELRDVVERASFTLHEAEVNLERLAAEAARLDEERTAAGAHLRDVGNRARGEIEARIAALKEQETAISSERIEQERLLYALLENDRRLESDAEAELRAHREREEAERSAAEDAVAQAHVAPDEAPPEDVAHHAELHAAPEPEAPTQPHYSTVSFTASPSTPRDPSTRPPAPETEDGLGFRSIIGNIFTRRKPEEPVVDEGPSIAERIARDFGMLGEPDEPEQPASDHALAEPHADH